jgi:hypothetical protein
MKISQGLANYPPDSGILSLLVLQIVIGIDNL